MATLVWAVCVLVIAVLAIWNHYLATENERLADLCARLRADLVDFSVVNKHLRVRNETLIENVAQLVSERRVRDAHGRFAKQ